MGYRPAMGSGTHPTVAVAESCTGGLLAAELVAIPGSGDWFRGGLVAYHPPIKYRLLGVPEGPVISEAAALAMAEGARELLGAEVGLAITGVAGPEPEEGQPVGTVFVAVVHPRGRHAVGVQYAGDSSRIKAAAVGRALDELEEAKRQLGVEEDSVV